MENLTVDQWRERILAAWEKWGTGTPLDPRTVEHLAVEFAKPLMVPPKRWDWHKEKPYVVIPYAPFTGFPWSIISSLDMPKDEIKLAHPDGRVDRIVNIGTEEVK